MRVAAIMAMSLTLFACAGEPLEFADWTIPVPEGTLIIEYPAVPMEERTEVLELERDLVITEAFGRPLYRPRDLDVAPDGRIFVYDNGNHRVVSFDGNGLPLKSLGREGQGPGEFKGGGHLCVVADRVVVYDFGNQRLSIFGLGGDLIADHGLPARFGFSEMKGAGAGLVIIDHPGKGVPPMSIPWIARRFSLEGEPLSQIIELETGEQTYWKTENGMGTVPMHEPWPVAAFSRGGSAYVSSGDRYQVLALDPEGNARWALAVAYEIPTPTREEKEAAIQVIDRWLDGAGERLADHHFVWPDQYAVIEGLQVDGQGNLYVFPHAPVSPLSFTNHMEHTEAVPIDVYSPEGDRLFAGKIRIDSWNAALGDYLYRIETDPESEERVVARYRLVEPF